MSPGKIIAGKSDRELGPGISDTSIVITIGKHGELILAGGAHLLEAAMAGAAEKVSVKIVGSHPAWTRFRRKILFYAQENGGKLYQPILHPDLREIPALHPSEDRFQMIKSNLSSRNGSLLDIGAHWGYFSHRFEEEGFECYAVEDFPDALYFLRRLRRAGNRTFKIIGHSILGCKRIEEMEFHVVLALNVFHHFIKEKQLVLSW